MISQQIKELKTSDRDLRRFGIWVGGVFSLLGLFLWWKQVAWHAWIWCPGVILIVTGGMFPRCLKYIYIGWMTLGIVLGTIVGTILLTFFFYIVLTPVGLLSHLVGKDFLSLKKQGSQTSYWRKRKGDAPKNPEDYERQF